MREEITISNQYIKSNKYKEVDMENQEKSSGIEAFLFKLTRTFAISGSLIGLLALAIVIINLIPSKESTYISLDDIADVTQTSEGMTEFTYFPENVEKYLFGENEKILLGWLDGLSSQDQRQEFVDNLSEVIESAEQSELDVNKVINSYKTAKLSKLNKNDMSGYKGMMERATNYVVISSIITFIALMSLILVMLAIERNTRHDL